ncbi:MAG: ATP-binding protein, partial [Bacteroidota bacterium]
MLLSAEPSQSRAYFQVLRLFFGESWTNFLATQPQHTLDFFPRETSWIIFQVSRDDKIFTVAFFWDKGLHASFIQNPFETTLFLGKTKKPLTPANLFKSLRSKKILHTDPIDTSEAYQKILYGQLKGAAKRKWENFQLTKSIHAQDWLAQFASHQASLTDRVKHVLLRSIADTLTLDPKTLSQQIRDFHRNWQDIQAYQHNLPAFQALLAQFQQYQQIQKESENLHNELASHAQSLAQERTALLTRVKEQKELPQQELALYEKNIQEKQTALYKSIKAWGLAEEKINIAEKKIAQYREVDTPQWKASWQIFLQENLPNLPENQWQESANTLIQATYAQEKKRVAEAYIEKVATHHTAYEQVLTELNSEFYKAKNGEIALLSHTLNNISSILEQEKPVEDQGTALKELELQQQLDTYRAEWDHLESQQEGARTLIILKLEAAQEKYTFQQAPVQARLDQLNTWIDKRGSSFFGWLENRYPGWQKTIGKVIKEDVLFHNYLNPNVVRLNDLLYGIHLDLGEVEKKGPTTEELYEEVEELKFQLEEGKKR